MLIGEGFESGGAGLIGSVADYARFANAMCLGGTSPQGARILSRATIDLMRTNFLTAEMAPYFNWEQFVGYGYGLGVRCPKEGSPVSDFGWGGAAGAFLAIDVQNAISIYFGTHALSSPVQGLRSMLYRFVRAELIDNNEFESVYEDLKDLYDYKLTY